MPAAAIDPDHYLDLSRLEPFSPEEGRAAWEQAYSALEEELSLRGTRAKLFVVLGLQAGGKSTWVEHQLLTAVDDWVFFSGPLPSAAHRLRALELGRRFGATAIGVWVKVPLELALARNAQRTGLARVPEGVIRHVHENLEPPSLTEGFHEVVVVEAPPAEA
jgi:hypothetical protein